MRAIAEHPLDAYRVSERRSCAVTVLHRSTCLYVGTREDDVLMRRRIHEITAVQVRYGYRRIHILIRREGNLVNQKNVYRLYREEGLHLRRRRLRRRVGAVVSVPSTACVSLPQRVSMSVGAWILWPTVCSTGTDAGAWP